MELRTEGPLLDVRVFPIPRFTGGALSISVAFFSLFGFIFLITQYFQFVKGYSTLSAGVHTLPFAVVAAVATPLAAVLALKIGTRVVVTTGSLLMAGGLVVAAFNSEATTAYWGPIIVAMVLLALGLSSITAPTTEAVMGSVPDEQRGAAAGVNNTTRELGGTLGVAVFGSIFASSYAPRIISAFRPLPIPAGPKTEAHQSDGGCPGRGPATRPRRHGRLSRRRLHALPQRAVGCVPRRGGGGSGRRRGGLRAAARPGARRSRARLARSVHAEAESARPLRTATGPCGELELATTYAPGRGAAGPAGRCYANTSSACRTPAMTGLGVRSTSPANDTDSKRASSSVSTTRPSSRARAAPRQKWGPKPKLTCGLGWRSTRSSPASGPNTSSSRLAEA